MSPVDSEILAVLAADASPDGLLVVDESGTIRFASQALAAMFGYTPREMVGLHHNVLVPQAVREAHRHHQQDFLEEGGARPMGVGMVLSGCRGDGSEFPVEISLRAIESGGERLVVACVRDMTERLAAQMELDEARERLHLTEERERIARDLHDSVIQQLFGTGLTLQSLASADRDPALAGRITEVVDQLDDIIRRVRTVIFGLHEHVGPEGLRDRISRLVAEAARALGFQPVLVFDGPLDTLVSAELAHQVLGVLRESLSNIARHAGATRAEVRVYTDGASVEVEVADNGRGLPDGGAGPGGQGLANLADRAKRMGGDCRIGPGTGGRGTLVRWCAPLT